MGRFTDPHFLRRAKSRKSPKRPALPGAVSRVWGGSPTHTLSRALFSHPSRCSYPGIFSTLPLWGRIWLLRAWNGSFPHPGEKTASQALTGQRNSVLFRRKRRVLRTRGFLTDQATGLVLHTGRNRRGLGSCCWVQKSRCPVLWDSSAVFHDSVCRKSSASSSSCSKRYLARR